MMPPNVQEQVVERVGSMETTPIDQIEVVASTLGARMGKKGQSPRVKTGGVKSAADLLNWFDKEEGKELLKSIEKGIPNLVARSGRECSVLRIWSDLVPAM